MVGVQNTTVALQTQVFKNSMFFLVLSCTKTDKQTKQQQQQIYTQKKTNILPYQTDHT